MAIASFPDSNLRTLATVLADVITHRELTDLFSQCGIAESDRPGGTPKWERILLALAARQRQDRCGNNAGAFIEAAMAPVRFVADHARFDDFRRRLNEPLAFSGLQLNDAGKLEQAAPAATFSEAQQRADRLRQELQRRHVHQEVLRFCRPELLQQNYFHAVLEATKSVAEKIRQHTGLTGDGAAIVDRAFGLARPLLALNSLQTDSEKSEQNGFANLLRGMFGTFRNPTAHAPKIELTVTEQDAFDLLSLVSYLHRRLDASVRTPWTPSD
jgi:uncharacterized protein (TIGR02391 family)